VTALVLVLRTDWAAGQLCARAETVVQQLIGQPLAMERCEIDPPRARIVVSGVRFGAAPGTPDSISAVGGPTAGAPLLSVGRLLVELSPFSYGRTLTFSKIEVEDPVLNLNASASDGEESGGPAADCLSIFDSVRVDSLVVRRGSVEVRLGDGETVRAQGIDLDLERRRRSWIPALRRPRQGEEPGREGRLGLRGDRYRLEIARAAGSYDDGAGTKIPLESLEAEVLLDTGGERLRVERLAATLPGLELQASGSILDLCAPVLDLGLAAQVDLEKVASWASVDELTGTVEVDATLAGTVSAPVATAALRGRDLAYGSLTPDQLSAEVQYSGDRLLVNELIWPVGDGKARIHGSIELNGDLATEVEVRTEGLEFHRLMTRLGTQNTPVMTTVDSVHRLTGRLGGGLRLEGSSSLELRGFRVRNVPWHQGGGTVVVEIPGRALLETRVRLVPDGISLDHARLGFGAATTMNLTARLAFDEDEGMSIQTESPLFDLADIGGHVSGLPLAGRGLLEASVEGPYEDPTIEGKVDFEGARFYGAELGRVTSRAISFPGEQTLDFQGLVGKLRSTTYDAEVKLVLGSEPLLDAEVSVREGGRLGDLFEATSGLIEPLAWLHRNLDAEVRSVSASVKGELPEGIAGFARIDAGPTSFMDRPFDRMQTEVSLAGLELLRIEGFALERGEGRATGEATFTFPEGGSPRVQSEVEARRLPIRDLLGPFGEWAELEGGVSGSLVLEGATDHLQVRGEIAGERLGAMGVELAPTRLSLETQGDQVIIRGALVRAGLFSAAVRLADSLPFEAALDLDVADLRHFLPPRMGLGGSVSGSLSAAGTLADVPASSGAIALSTLRLSSDDFRVESPSPFALSFSGGDFALEPMELRGPNTQLRLQGQRQGGRYDLQARGSFDARLVENLLPQIEYAGGVIDLQAALTGTSSAPILVGSAQIRDATFRVTILPIHVQNFQGKLAFSQNQVVVEDARLGVNGGTGTLRGTVSLGDWGPRDFDLIFDGTQMSWRMPADWPAVVSGRVTLGGSWPNELLLGGQLTVDRLRYAKDLELEKAILDFRRTVHTPPPAEMEKRISFDLDLLGGSDMRVDNNLVRARIQFVGSPGGPRGRLKLVGDNLRMGLLGSVEVVEGVAFFRGNEYRLTHGMIDFAERDRIDPTFDFTAETEVRDYRVTAHASGRLGEGTGSGYHLDLSSEPMLAQADIVTLLTFGITSWDLDRGGNAALGAGVAAEALLAVSGLDEHVKRWLPQTPLFMDPDLSVSSQYSELTGQMEPMAVFEARILTDRLKLTAAAPFSTTKGRRASMEVRVSELMSTQLVWQNEVVGYSSGDLGLDLKLRWEWE